MMKYLAILLVALAVVAAQITDIEVDVQGGTVFVTDSTHLYELAQNSKKLVQKNAHNLPSNGDVAQNSLFVSKVAGQRRLYALVDDTQAGTTMEYFPVPISGRANLKAGGSASVAGNPVFGNVMYDSSRNYVVFGNVGNGDRNVTLADLTTLKVLDSQNSIAYRTRGTGYNLVLNHNNNHLIVLSTYRPVQNPAYGISVDEYQITAAGKLTSVTSTYKCFCDGADYASSPYYHVTLVEQDCQIDYNENKLWCATEGANSDQFRGLYKFKAADDLSSSQRVPIAVAYDFIVYDFVNKFAYAISAAASGKGFSVYKLNINTGAVIATYTNTVQVIDPFTSKLDPSQPQLYVPCVTKGTTRQIVAVNTNGAMSGQVISLSLKGSGFATDTAQSAAAADAAN